MRLPLVNGLAVAGGVIIVVNAGRIVTGDAREVIRVPVLRLDKVGAAATGQQVPPRTP